VPFVYFHKSDGTCICKDFTGRYFVDHTQVQQEAKRLLVSALLETDVTGETMGVGIEARDLSGRTVFQISVVASVW
jgi:hypothetical protein